MMEQQTPQENTTPPNEDSIDFAWNVYGQLIKEEEGEKTPDIIMQCPCGSDWNAQDIHDDHASGDRVCTQCGFVFSARMIDTGMERRIFSSEGDSTYSPYERTGWAPHPLLPLSSLNTRISLGGGVDGVKLRKVHSWGSMTRHEALICNLLKYLQHLTGNQRQAITQQIVHHTISLFSQVTSKPIKPQCDKNNNDNNNNTTIVLRGQRDIFRGRIRTALLAACLYHVMKDHNMTWTWKEICDMLAISRGDMVEGCSRLYKVISAKSHMQSKPEMQQKLTKNGDMALRLAEKLGLPYRVADLCRRLMNAMDELHIMTHMRPMTLISGALYFIAHNELSISGFDRHMISKVTGVWPGNIYKTACTLSTYRQVLFSHLLAEKKPSEK